MKWHVEKRKISDLREHPKNPRYLSKHDAKHLQESIEKFGLIDLPIITSDGLIIGGHQRLKVLKKLAVKEVDCWVCDEELSDKEIDELNIRLNRNTGQFDFDTLANEWDMGELVEWGFDVNEFDVKLEIEDDSEDEDIEEDKCPTCGKKQKKKK